MVSKRAVASRRAFRKQYGQLTNDIVRLFLKKKGTWRSWAIGADLQESPSTVAAVLANLTRGTYAPYVSISNSKVRGTCKF